MNIRSFDFSFAKNRVWLCLGSAHKLLNILSAKCPVFLGLLRTDYVKLFLNDPLALIVLTVVRVGFYSSRKATADLFS